MTAAVGVACSWLSKTTTKEILQRRKTGVDVNHHCREQQSKN